MIGRQPGALGASRLSFLARLTAAFLASAASGVPAHAPPALCAAAALVVALVLPARVEAAGSATLASHLPGEPAGDTLTVCFTGETRGNLTPCSCPEKSLGGLARRTLFLRERARRTNGLALDSGGFLPEGEVPLRDDPALAARLVRLLLRAMKESGVRATALDHKERIFLASLAPAETKAADGIFLEADPPGPPLVIPWRTRSLGERRIGLLAFEESLPDSVMRSAATRARAACDLLIVLGRASAASGRRVARLSGADLVVLSRGARPSSPLEEGGSILVGCGAEGREVGEIRLVLDASGRLRPAGFRLHPMDREQPEDPGLREEVEKLLRDGGAGALVDRGHE